MSKPQSFKDMFARKTQVPFDEGKKILPVSNPIKLSQEEELRRLIRKNELKEISNKERCFVCGSQVDGNINHDNADLYCVENNSHFIIKYNFGNPLPTLVSSIYYFTLEAPVGYQVVNKFDGNTYFNSIFKLDLNLIEKFRFRDKIKIINYSGSMITFKRDLTLEEFERKIKLYATFN